MIRKLCTVAALVAGLAGVSAGVAYADTPHTPAPAHLGGLGGHHFGGTFWRGRDGVVLPYDQVVSSCGCGGAGVEVNPVVLGYTEVVQQQVGVIPVGGVETGDGSCDPVTGLPFESFGRLGFGLGLHDHFGLHHHIH